ncbi:unnamed protein product [Cuscuta europaea]|uniref:Uncharacterized protein n=1 Tax=Cuscuta europaea TaxID=41803 RepID=A0A9P0VMY8_CUSEU|nr:unnamed protein product [Cuscuta europaea]
METSTSKRRVYSSEQQSSTLSDAASKTNLADLQKGLPPGKKLVEGRNYMVRKSKKRKEYWLDFIEYLEEGSLRSEYFMFMLPLLTPRFRKGIRPFDD